VTISARNWAWAVRTRRTDSGEKLLLKAGEKVTLLYLAEMENAEEGCAYPAVRTIAEYSGQSVRTVDGHLRTLVDANAIRIEKKHRSRDGRWLRNTYLLNVPDVYRETDPEWNRFN
jgi:DNA-binding MarR family transcriptional regulator